MIVAAVLYALGFVLTWRLIDRYGPDDPAGPAFRAFACLFTAVLWPALAITVLPSAAWRTLFR